MAVFAFLPCEYLRCRKTCAQAYQTYQASYGDQSYMTDIVSWVLGSARRLPSTVRRPHLRARFAPPPGLGLSSRSFHTRRLWRSNCLVRGDSSNTAMFKQLPCLACNVSPVFRADRWAASGPNRAQSAPSCCFQVVHHQDDILRMWEANVHEILDYLSTVPLRRLRPDITYLWLCGGFVYLTAVIDWFSRYVLSSGLSNRLEAESAWKPWRRRYTRAHGKYLTPRQLGPGSHAAALTGAPWQ